MRVPHPQANRSASWIAPLLLCSAALSAALPHTAKAQLIAQPTGFSVNLDTGAILAERPQRSLPLWLESVSMRRLNDEETQQPRARARLWLRHLGGLFDTIEIRVGIAAGLGDAVVTAWNETGREFFRSPALGSATSGVNEVFRIEVEGVDYIEVDLPGKGERLQSLFATALRKSQVLHSPDFPPPAISDAFGGALASTPLPEQDRLLFNRVSAPIEAGPFEVTSEGWVPLEFELATPPSFGLLTFEVRNVDPENPLSLTLNEAELPPASFSFPDLADPAWRARGSATSGTGDVHYTGWVRVQQFVPGSVLQKGMNSLLFAPVQAAESVEVRRVELQLKYQR